MKAIVYREYGTWETLKLEEVAKPSPGKGQVLVRVLAVGLNDWDWQMLQGIPFVNRLENGLRRPRKIILGLDIAGRVESVGEGVTRFRPGDEVYGDISGTWGGFAEYVAAPETRLAPKPAGLSFLDAAATSHAAHLAVQGLVDAGRIGQGDKVLINGGFAILGDPVVGNRQSDVVTYGVSLARALTQAAEVVGEVSGRIDTRDHTPERPGTTRGALRLGARYTVGGWRGDGALVFGLTGRDPGIGFAAGFTYVFNAFQIP